MFKWFDCTMTRTWLNSINETTQDCQEESAFNCWRIPNEIIKSHTRQGKTNGTKNRGRRKGNKCVISRIAKTDFTLSIRIDGRSTPLAGASHVKQLFVYLSYPAGQLSSAISGTTLSSNNHGVTTHTPCASTSVPASAPGSRITKKKFAYS